MIGRDRTFPPGMSGIMWWNLTKVLLGIHLDFSVNPIDWMSRAMRGSTPPKIGADHQENQFRQPSSARSSVPACYPRHHSWPRPGAAASTAQRPGRQPKAVAGMEAWSQSWKMVPELGDDMGLCGFPDETRDSDMYIYISWYIWFEYHEHESQSMFHCYTNSALHQKNQWI